MKDPDKQAVYDAEEFVFGNTLFDELVTDADIIELGAELFGSDWWAKNKIPVPEVRLRRLEATHSVARSYYPSSGRPPEIAFSHDQVNPWTLAHEAAHVAQHHIYNYSITPLESHGAEFRDMYVIVAGILCGRQAADALATSFATRVPPRPFSASTCMLLTRDEEGIFPRWRLKRQVEQMNRLKPTRDSIRINGAIAL